MSSAAQQRAAIRRLTGAVVAHMPVVDVYQIAVQEIRRLTGASRVAICLLTPGRDMLDFVAVAGNNFVDITGLRIRVTDSLSQGVISSGKPLILDGKATSTTGNLFADMQETLFDAEEVSAGLPVPFESEDLERASNSGSTTAIVVPLTHEGRIIGTLSAMNKAGIQRESMFESFEADDVDVLELFAEVIGLSRILHETERQAREAGREAAVLYEAAQTVSSTLNIQEVMESVLDAICTHLEHHTAALFLLNDERTHLFLAAERGLSEDERDIQLAMDSGGMHTTVLDNDVPLLVDNPDGLSNYEDVSSAARSLSVLMAPIKSRDETHGLIIVSSQQRHAYRDDDLKLLSAVATQAGIAFENALLYEDSQRRTEEASALYDLSQHLNSTLHLDRALNFVADSVVNLLKIDRFALMLYDELDGRLTTRIVRNVDLESFSNIRPRTGEGIAGWVYQFHTPQAVADVVADARNASAPIDSFDVASTLCVPMQAGDDVIGVIHAMSSRRRRFTVAEMELLYTIANQAASAVLNARLYQQARTRSQEMRRYFNRVSQAIGNTLEEQDLPKLLADLSVEIMQSDRCTVYRIEGNHLVLQASSRFRTSAPADPDIALGSGLTGWVARRGQSLVVTDLDEDYRANTHSWLHRDKMASYLGIPIRSGRRVVGVIEVFTVEPRRFTREEVQLFVSFARRARVAEKLTVG